jgi:hypothetical protein
MKICVSHTKIGKNYFAENLRDLQLGVQQIIFSALGLMLTIATLLE